MATVPDIKANIFFKKSLSALQKKIDEVNILSNHKSCVIQISLKYFDPEFLENVVCFLVFIKVTFLLHSMLQPVTKYLRLTLVFMWSSALWEKFNVCFSRVFLLALRKPSIWQGDWALAYHSMGFRHFPDIS